MNTHAFSISDCGPISHADIRLHGITVLAGENGSGKSTVARWLNASLFVMNRYEQLVEEDGKRAVEDKLRHLTRALPFGAEEFSGLRSKLEDIYYIDSSINKMPFPELVEFYMSSVQEFCDAMLFRSSDASSLDNEFHYDTRRINAFFGVRAKKDEEYAETVERLRRRLESDVNEIVTEIDKKKTERTANNFSVYMTRLLSAEEASSRSVEIGFSEDGQNLMLDDFKMPLAISRAIYLDTRKLCDYLKPRFAGYIDNLLRKQSPAPLSKESKMLIRALQFTIGGDVNYKSQPVRKGTEVFRFVTPEGLDIPLQNAATGVISFSILLRLLQNGWLDDSTMLIIDEPEGHLHPQWIVEYARLLVKLHKHLGVKVMVSSHNPDMVAAIQSISRKEKVLDRTLFYLAERDDKEGMPTYHTKDLGHEIGEIFDSFNIALDRIDQYGQEE